MASGECQERGETGAGAAAAVATGKGGGGEGVGRHKRGVWRLEIEGAEERTKEKS